MTKNVYSSLDLAGISLADSGFTLSFVVDKLLKYNTNFCDALGNGKVNEVTVRDITDGQGHVAVIYRVLLEITGGNANSYSFVMKVLKSGKFKKLAEGAAGKQEKKEKPATELPITAQAHNAECDFYHRMKAETVIPLPEVWYTQKVSVSVSVFEIKAPIPVILIEDLSEVAYCGKYEDGVSLEQIKTVVRHLARFHAFQMAHIGPSLADLNGISPVSIGYEKMFHAFMPKLIEFDPDELRPLVEKFTPLVSTQFAEFALLKRHEELGTPTLLCHGDLWTSNVMLRKHLVGGRTSDIAAFIDWQIIFHGNPMFDVARYVICAAAEVRREAESLIAQFYHDEVAKNLGEFGHSLPESFTVENLTEAYKLAFIRAAVTISFDPPFFAKASREAGMVEDAVEAQVAKLLARTRAAIEDALKTAEEVAPHFLVAYLSEDA